MKELFKKVKAIKVVVAVSAIAPVLAHAQASSVSVSQLTSQVSFADASTGILAVGVSLAGFFVIWRSARAVLSMIKR